MTERGPEYALVVTVVVRRMKVVMALDCLPMDQVQMPLVEEHTNELEVRAVQQPEIQV